METGIKCSIGIYLKEDCHLESYSTKKELHKIKWLKKDDTKLLHLRIPEIRELENQTICSHHLDRYLNYYSARKKKCCDPWNIHSKNILTDLHEVQLELSEKFKTICNINLIPGEKVCRNCLHKFSKRTNDFKTATSFCIDPYKNHRKKIVLQLETLTAEWIQFLKEAHSLTLTFEHKICMKCKTKIELDILQYRNSKKESGEHSSDNFESEQCVIETSESQNLEYTPDSIYQSSSQKKRCLDDVLSLLDIPPFKRKKLPDTLVAKKGCEILQAVAKQVSNTFQEVYNVKLLKFDNLHQLHQKSSWLNDILVNIQSKLNTCKTINEKISLLSIIPDDWSYKITTQYFQCSYYMYAEAKKLKNSMGIFGQRARKSYLRISPEIRKEIEDYYLNDSNSIICSGMKECVTIKVSGGTTIKLQKRILTFDLSDLYKNCIQDSGHQNVPCLTFFAQLRPQQCIFAGDPGSHNICVCSIHQNVKLKLSAIAKNINYKQVIEAGVCDVENKFCMFKNCDKCAKEAGIRQLLTTQTENKNIEVKYCNWTPVSVLGKTSKIAMSSRVTLKNFTTSVDLFLDSLTEDIWNMTEHHFISFQQQDYFVQCKKDLNNQTGLLVMDFAENYSYICQNSTQGFYFNNNHASIFTAVLYYKDETDVSRHQTFCVISDSTIHQAYSVHKFMEVVLTNIKSKFSWIESLYYYSDGAPTQFKNKNHFVNLCFHERDFGIKVLSYNFFAASHGKSVCDGVRGTAKRIARKASLQGIPILNAKEMYTYLSENESAIWFSYVPENEINIRGNELAKRFSTVKTIKNTRQFHYFEPIDEETIKVKLFSLDTEYEIVNIQ